MSDETRAGAEIGAIGWVYRAVGWRTGAVRQHII